MSSIGDLVIHIAADASDAKRELAATGAAVRNTAVTIASAGTAITRGVAQFAEAHPVLVKLGTEAVLCATGYKSLGVALLAVEVGMGAVKTAASALTPEMITAASTATLAAIELGKIGIAVTKTGFQIGMYVASAGIDAVRATASLVYEHQSLLTVAGLLVPQIGLVTATINMGITAHKAAVAGVNDLKTAYVESVNRTGDLIPEYNRLDKSLKDLSKTYGSLQSQVTTPFVDGKAAVGGYVESFSPVPAAAQEAGTVVRGTNIVLKELSGYLRETSIVAVGLANSIAYGTPYSYEAAKGYVAQGDALKQMAAESEKAIAKQESLRSTFQGMLAVQEGAKAKAASGSELGKIGGITTVAGIDDAVRARQKLGRETRLAGKDTDFFKQSETAAFDALAKQRQGIIDGTIVSKEAKAEKEALAKAEQAVAQAMKSSEDELEKLMIGEDQARLAALARNGATQEEIAAEGRRLAQIKEIKTAKDEEKKATEAANKAAEQAVRHAVDQAKSEAKLRDEIAVGNGEMTKREARIAELMRDGKSAKEADTLASLEFEKNRVSTKTTSPAFTAMNSAAALSIINRTANGRSPDETTAANTGRMVKLMEQQNKQDKSGRVTGPTLTNLDRA